MVHDKSTEVKIMEEKSRTKGAKDKKKRKTIKVGNALFDAETGSEIFPEGHAAKRTKMIKEYNSAVNRDPTVLMPSGTPKPRMKSMLDNIPFYAEKLREGKA